MLLEVCWDGPWTLSFGLSQVYGHGSWLVCVKGPLNRDGEREEVVSSVVAKGVGRCPLIVSLAEGLLRFQTVTNHGKKHTKS